MTSTMGADLRKRSAVVNRAVSVYHKVIADALETSLAMPSVNLLYGEILALGSGGTMDDDFSNFAHGYFLFMVL